MHHPVSAGEAPRHATLTTIAPQLDQLVHIDNDVDRHGRSSGVPTDGRDRPHRLGGMLILGDDDMPQDRAVDLFLRAGLRKTNHANEPLLARPRQREDHLGLGKSSVGA